MFLKGLNVSAPFLPTPSATVYDLFVRGLHWLRIFFQLLLPWPVVIIAVAALFFGSRDAFAHLLDLLGTFRKLKVFGTEIELTEETRRKLQVAAGDISAALEVYRTGIDQEVRRLAARFQLPREVARLVDKHVYTAFDRVKLSEHEFRCTVYIPDPVLQGYLYQAIDYTPTGGGVGRSFSERYGIIGKVWRSEKSLCVNTLLHGLKDAPLETQIAQITLDWGMTRAEAERVALSRPSYICVPLEHEGTKIGVFHMDCKMYDAFAHPMMPASLVRVPNENTDTFYDRIARHVQEIANEMLAAKLAKIVDEVTTVTLNVNLEHQ